MLLATRQTVGAGDLHAAIHEGLERQGLAAPATVELPSDEWVARYRQAVKAAPGVTQRTADEALEVARALLDPVLRGKDHGRWEPADLAWEG